MTTCLLQHITIELPCKAAVPAKRYRSRPVQRHPILPQGLNRSRRDDSYLSVLGQRDLHDVHRHNDVPGGLGDKPDEIDVDAIKGAFSLVHWDQAWGNITTNAIVVDGATQKALSNGSADHTVANQATG